MLFLRSDNFETRTARRPTYQLTPKREMYGKKIWSLAD